MTQVSAESAVAPAKLAAFDEALASLREWLQSLLKLVEANKEADVEKAAQFRKLLSDLDDLESAYAADRDALLADIGSFVASYGNQALEDNARQHEARASFDPLAERAKGLVKQVEMLFKFAVRAADTAERELGARDYEEWDGRAVNRLKRELEQARTAAAEQLKRAAYFHRQVIWLQTRFPEARLAEVPGLVKLVDRAEIEANDWSLTPGRYVGVTPLEVDEDFDLEETLRGIHADLAYLNREAALLAHTIQQNFETLGV